MPNRIIDFARRSRTAPQEAEREVVAAISSAEGSLDLPRPAGGRTFGLLVPFLALAAGAALGYSSTRWLRLSPWRRVPPDPWRRVADAARTILDAAGKARFPTLH
jgi:hypothetical protein